MCYFVENGYWVWEVRREKVVFNNLGKICCWFVLKRWRWCWEVVSILERDFGRKIDRI